MLGLCEKKISDLVNPTLNKCSLSLGERNDKPTCKKKRFAELRMVKNWLKNDKNQIKGVQYNPKTLNSSCSLQITSSGWRHSLKRQRAIIESRVDQIQYLFHIVLTP